MLEYLKLAWRNIWRNKRRTLITTASVFFAVLLSIMSRAFHLGAWDYMIDGILHSYSGYIQVHKKGFWNDKTFDYSLEISDSLLKQIRHIPEVRNIIPRLESFALISTGNKTKGVIVNGIEPLKEDSFTGLSKHLYSGKYLNLNDSAVLVSSKLSEFLKVNPGDTIILIGQGYQGSSAAGKYPVKGIIRLPSVEFDNKMVYLPLPLAQDFYSADGQLTSLVIDIKNPHRMEKTADAIAAVIPATYEVMTWKEMLDELYQQFVLDNSGGIIMLFILYLIVGFGVFGTVLMMTSERMREFGILIAIGMQKKFILLMVSLEMFFIVLLGLTGGMIFSLPLITYFHFNPIPLSGETARLYELYGMQPILPVAWRSDYIINQGFVVLIIVLLAISYPLYVIGKTNVTKALRK